MTREPLLQRRVDAELRRLTLIGTAVATLVLTGVVALAERQATLEQIGLQAKRAERELLEQITSGQSLAQVQRQLQITAAASDIALVLLVNQSGRVIAANDGALIGAPLARPMLDPISDAVWEGIVPCLPSSHSQWQHPRCRQPISWITGPWRLLGGDRLVGITRTPLAFADRPGLEQGGLLLLRFDLSGSLRHALTSVGLTVATGMVLLLLTNSVLVAEVRRRLVTRLVWLARIDRTTGLLNREAWLEEVEPWLAEQQTQGQTVLLAVAGLDHFKSVNSRHGYDGGDRVLSAVSTLLRQRLVEGEWVARLAGDQFAICLRGGNVQVDRFRDLCAAVAERSWDAEPGHPIHLTLSVGVACSSGPAGWSLGKLLAQADRNLRLAKQEGGNQVMNR
jgi:diguanylate cyclase (GGDEF)-like protein